LGIQGPAGVLAWIDFNVNRESTVCLDMLLNISKVSQNLAGQVIHPCQLIGFLQDKMVIFVWPFSETLIVGSVIDEDDSQK
jgi:hypothetical protein